MAVTKVENLIQPEVMAEAIAHKLEAKLKASPFSKLDTTLQGTAGLTITVPSYVYGGEAEDLVEGQEMTATLLEMSSRDVTVKQAGKAFKLTDKAVLGGYGDPLGNAEKQLLDSIADKIDTDHFEAFAQTSLEYNFVPATEISYELIVGAVDKFAEEDDEPKYLFINPAQKTQLRLDPKFVESVPNAYTQSNVSEIGGCIVVASNKIKKDAEGNYLNFIVKPEATTIYLKKDVEVETERNSLAKTTYLSADAFYAVALENEGKVVKFKSLAE